MTSETQRRRKQPSYIRHSTTELLPVLDAIKDAHERKLWKVKLIVNEQSVNISSLRLLTFAVHGTTCVTCGLKASFFALEHNHADKLAGAPYHLNLWGINDKGEEVLFTHDHILARGLDGRDHLENTQTMCGYCNWEKGEVERELVKQHRANKSS